MKHVVTFVHGFIFWSFIAVKVAGTSLADWSWWWMLLPQVPFLALVFKRAGLL